MAPLWGNSFAQLGLMAAIFARPGRAITGNCVAVARCGQLDVSLRCAIGNTCP